MRDGGPIGLGTTMCVGETWEMFGDRRRSLAVTSPRCQPLTVTVSMIFQPHILLSFMSLGASASLKSASTRAALSAVG